MEQESTEKHTPTCQGEGLFLSQERRHYCWVKESFEPLLLPLRRKSFMLNVLIQIQCPRVELLFSERKSSFGVFTSPLLVIYHQPLRKVLSCVVTKIYFIWHQKNRVQVLALLLTSCVLTGEPLLTSSSVSSVWNGSGWDLHLWLIHPFLWIHSFVHLLCGRHCAKCSECKARHGPCCHVIYIPVRETIKSSHWWIYDCTP